MSLPMVIRLQAVRIKVEFEKGIEWKQFQWAPVKLPASRLTCTVPQILIALLKSVSNTSKVKLFSYLIVLSLTPSMYWQELIGVNLSTKLIRRSFVAQFTLTSLLRPCSTCPRVPFWFAETIKQSWNRRILDYWFSHALMIRMGFSMLRVRLGFSWILIKFLVSGYRKFWHSWSLSVVLKKLLD